MVDDGIQLFFAGPWQSEGYLGQVEAGEFVNGEKHGTIFMMIHNICRALED